MYSFGDRPLSSIAVSTERGIRGLKFSRRSTIAAVIAMIPLPEKMGRGVPILDGRGGVGALSVSLSFFNGIKQIAGLQDWHPIVRRPRNRGLCGLWLEGGFVVESVRTRSTRFDEVLERLVAQHAVEPKQSLEWRSELGDKCWHSLTGDWPL